MSPWLDGGTSAAVLVVGLLVAGRAAAVVLARFGARWNHVMTVQAAGATIALLGGVVVARLLPLQAVVGLPGLAVLGAVTTTAIAGAGIGAFKRGLRPVTVDHSDRFVTPPLEYRLAVVGTILVFMLALAAVIYDLAPVGWVVLLALGAGLWFGRRNLQLRLAPMSMGVFRPPTADERQRVAACYDSFDRTPPEIAVIPIEVDYQNFVVYGIGSRTWLIVDEAILAEFSETELTVALAQADEKHRNGFHRVQTGAALLVVSAAPWILWLIVQSVLGIASSGTDTLIQLLSQGPVIVLLFLAIVSLSSLSRRRQYAADTFASATLGAGTVRAVYEHVGERIWSVPEDIPFPIPDAVLYRLSPAPPMHRRLERVDDAG